LAFAIEARWAKLFGEGRVEVTMVSVKDSLKEEFGDAAARRVKMQMERRGIKTVYGERVDSFAEE